MHDETARLSHSTTALQRDGKLVFTADGARFEGVVPVRVAIQSPEDGISVVNLDGEEVASVDALQDVPEPVGTLIRGTCRPGVVPVLKKFSP